MAGKHDEFCEIQIGADSAKSTQSSSTSTSLESFPKREKWASRWEYLLSLAGIAIGLGNVWRFPYVCFKNGGGAFLVPYLLMLVVIGLPIFLLESSLGQFSSSGCITLYEACPAFKGIGYASVLVTLIASIYYSVVIAYPLVFVPYCFSYEVPWATCDNVWNTPNCVRNDAHSQHINETNFTQIEFGVSPADEFFHNKILQISSGITEPNGLVMSVTAATIFVWVFVFLCIFKGVKVVGKVVWFTSTFPFLMLFSLLIRGLTLPGAYDGIMYFIYPDFSKLANFQVWADAASQIFFSIQVGWGSLIAMGSYNGFRNNSLKDALWIPVVNCATSILAGFVVFSVLGFMALSKGVHVSDVVTAGPSLAFITYPEALAMMPWAPLWSIFFFLMLFILGAGSCFVQIEAIVSSISDEFPRLRHHKSFLSFMFCFFMMVCALSCCTRGGMYLLQLFDRYSVAVPISVTCLAEVFVFCYIYGGGKIAQDVQMMTRKKLNIFWWSSWMFFTPAALLLIAINNVVDISVLQNSYRDYIFPEWTEYIGWALAFIPVSAIPVLWIMYMISGQGSLKQRLHEGHNPTETWGPKPCEERQQWNQTSSRSTFDRKYLHPRLQGFDKARENPAISFVPKNLSIHRR